jgi:hypothetical protein
MPGTIHSRDIVYVNNAYSTWCIESPLKPLAIIYVLGNLPPRHAAPVVLFLVVYYLFRVFLLTSRWQILSNSYSQNYRGSELYGLKYLLIWSVLFWASAYLPFKNWCLKQKSSRSYRRRIPIFFWVRILINFISSF